MVSALPPDQGTVILGRDAELQVLERFVTSTDPGVTEMGLIGEFGSGKTLLFDHAVAHATASGRCVLVLRPRATESAITWVGLRDLLAQVGEEVAESLRPEHLSLLRAAADPPLEAHEGGPADRSTNPLAVPAATLSLLEANAACAPTLLAVDSLQWLDDASTRALSFAVQRCRGTITVLWTQTDLGTNAGGLRTLGDRAQRLQLDGLSDDHIRQIVIESQAARLDRSDLDRLVHSANGVPLLALELARSGVDGPTSDRPVDASIETALRERLANLPAASRHIIEASSCSSRLTIAQLGNVLGQLDPGLDPTEVDDAVEVAEDAGLVRLVDGEVHVLHDAWVSSVYDGLGPSHRRAVHRAVASVMTRRSEELRHRIHGSVRAPADLLDEVDAAAAVLASSGAPGGAAELLELALASAPDDRSTPYRRLAAARHRIAMGDLDRAVETLAPVLSSASSDTEVWARAAGLRALQLLLRGDVEGASRGFEDAVEASVDPTTITWANLHLAFLLTNTNRLREAKARLTMVESMAEAVPPSALAAVEATIVMVDVLCGGPIDWEKLDSAVETEESHGPAEVPVTSRPTLIRALLRRTAWQHTAAMTDLDRLREQVLLDGDDTALMLTDLWAAGVAAELGLLDLAEDRVSAAAGRARLVGGSEAWVAAATSTVAAWGGDEDGTRQAAQAALTSLGPESPLAAWPLSAQAHIALAVGDLKTALDGYEVLAEHAHRMGVAGPAQWWTPDLVEVLAGLGLTDRAAAALRQFDVNLLGPQSVDARAVESRCLGVIAAARGDLVEAEEYLCDAIRAHTEHDGTVGRARAELHLGKVLRRQRRRSEARTHLTRAMVTFEHIGATAWSSAASAELERLGARSRREGTLTETERRVAGRVADGLTNREIADALFMSPKTVEAHLTRIYRAAGVRSRAGLVALRPNRPDLFD